MVELKELTVLLEKETYDKLEFLYQQMRNSIKGPVDKISTEAEIEMAFKGCLIEKLLEGFDLEKAAAEFSN